MERVLTFLSESTPPQLKETIEERVRKLASSPPVLGLALALNVSEFSAEQARSLLFDLPLSTEAASHYVRILSARSGSNGTADDPLLKAHVSTVAVIYLHHAHQWADFCVPFICAGGLTALASLAAHSNRFLRSQALEALTRMTSLPEFNWIDEAASEQTRRLHAGLLALGLPSPSVGGAGTTPSTIGTQLCAAPLLSLLLNAWVSSFPSESQASLQLLAFWLSWARRLYTLPFPEDRPAAGAGTGSGSASAVTRVGGGALYLSQSILRRLRAWSFRRVGSEAEIFAAMDAVEAAGGTGGAVSGSSVPVVDETSSADVAAKLPPIAAEEADLARKLFEDFSHFHSAEEAEADKTVATRAISIVDVSSSSGSAAGGAGAASGSAAASASLADATRSLAYAAVLPAARIGFAGLALPADMAIDAARFASIWPPELAGAAPAGKAAAEGSVSAASATAPAPAAATVASAASAATATAATPAALPAVCKARKEEGNTAFAQGKWAAAIRSYSAGIAAAAPALAALAASATSSGTASAASSASATVTSPLAAQELRLIADLHANRAAAVLRLLAFDDAGMPPPGLLGVTGAGSASEAGSDAAPVLTRAPATIGSPEAGSICIVPLRIATSWLAGGSTDAGRGSTAFVQSETQAIAAIHGDSELQALAISTAAAVFASLAEKQAAGKPATGGSSDAVVFSLITAAASSAPEPASHGDIARAVAVHLLLAVGNDCDAAGMLCPTHAKAMFRRCQALLGLRRYSAALAAAQSAQALVYNLQGKGGSAAGSAAAKALPALEMQALASLATSLATFSMRVAAVQQADSGSFSGSSSSGASALSADEGAGAPGSSVAAASKTSTSDGEELEYSAPAVTRRAAPAEEEGSILAALLARSEFGSSASAGATSAAAAAPVSAGAATRAATSAGAGKNGGAGSSGIRSVTALEERFRASGAVFLAADAGAGDAVKETPSAIDASAAPRPASSSPSAASSHDAPARAAVSAAKPTGNVSSPLFVDAGSSSVAGGATRGQQTGKRVEAASPAVDAVDAVDAIAHATELEAPGSAPAAAPAAVAAAPTAAAAASATPAPGRSRADIMAAAMSGNLRAGGSGSSATGGRAAGSAVGSSGGAAGGKKALPSYLRSLL